MDFSKNFTRVTKTSKIIALTLFVTLPFVGFYLGIRFQKIRSTEKYYRPTTPISGIENKHNTDEEVSNTPARVVSYQSTEGGKILKLDYLEKNPNFLPGETPFFINESTETINVILDSNSKFLDCFYEGDFGKDPTLADVEVPLKELVHKLENFSLPQTYYFTIENGKIITIFYPCLP